MFAWFCCGALPQQQPSSPSESSHVADNNVYVFPGDKCGVNLTGSADGTSVNVSYQPDLKKADLVLTFKKERKLMLLTVENRAAHWVSYEAYMKVPQRDGFYRTSVLPVGPHLSNFESWPQQILELEFKNFRLSDTAPGRGQTR
jgi:hypothetical protein